MAATRLEFLRVGLRKREVSTTLRLRWDRSPETCRAVAGALPLEDQVWHCRYSNYGVYMLLPLEATFGADPPREWTCAYPGPGDLLFLLDPPGPLAKNSGADGKPARMTGLPIFYDRGNTLYGPHGPVLGNIFATATSIEEIERFAVACNDVWFHGAAGETLYVEAA